MTDMNSITACRYPDQSQYALMDSLSSPTLADRHRKTLWKAQGVAYLLALLAHLGLWQIYRAMPTLAPVEIQPPPIEVELVVAKPAPAPATRETPPPSQSPLPKPQAQPPKPKSVPKVMEKPAPPKTEKPKPTLKSKPIPVPEAEISPAPVPEVSPPAAAVDPTPAPSTPVESPKAALTPTEGQANKSQTHTRDANEGHIHHGSISGITKRYPRIALERGWEGTVKLKIHILANGEIDDVIVISSSGHEVLDEQAVDLIKEAQAKPSRRGDTPIDDWVILPYKFVIKKQPKESDEDPKETQEEQ